MNENLIPPDDDLEEINTNKINIKQENNQDIEIENEININNLTLPSEKDILNEMKIECRMNHTLIEEKREQAYICPNCPDSQKILCSYCIEECHKSHRGNTKIDKLKGIFVNFEKNPCQCALNGHIITENKHNQKKEIGAEISTSYCIFLPLFLSANPKYYYKRKENGQIYCPFCMYNFQIADSKKNYNNFLNLIKNINEQEDLIKFESINEEEEFNEKYEKVLYHGDQELNCTCINNLHKHEVPTENIQSLTSFFFNDLTGKINIYKIAYQLFHNLQIINQLLPDFMIIHQKIMDCIENSKKQYGENDFYIELEDKMDWDAYLQLTKLLNMFSYFLKNYIKCEVQIYDDKFNEFYSYETINKLLSFKTNLEDKLFRIQVFSIKMYRRNLKFTILSQYFFIESNTSPIHRILLRNNYKDKKMFEEPFEIAKKVLELCESYQENNLIPQKEFTECFNEGLKIFKSILPSFCNNIEELKNIFNFIQEKLSCIKEKRDGLNEVIRTLEKITEKIIIYINDNIIYNNLIHVNDLYEHNKNEEPYAFMSENEFTKEMIETLFSFNIPINETNPYIRAHNFYDNLINSNDSYIEPLQNLANSTLSIQERKNCEIIIDMLKGESIVDLSEVNDIFIEIIKNLNNLLNNHIKEEEYLDLLTKNLNDLSNATTTFNYIQQISFYRDLYFHKLVNIMILSHKIINYCFNIEDEQSEEIINIRSISEKIYGNLKQIILNLCRDNTFITPLLFEKNNIDLMLDGKTDNLDFYTTTLRNMKNSNYKINTLNLTYYICENYNTYFKSLDYENNQKLLTILKLCKFILKLSSNKCIMEVNNLIATKIKMLLETQEFKSYLINLKTYQEQSIVIYTFKIINRFQREYIYLINPSIPIVSIIEKLENDALPINIRMIFSIVYTNYFVKSYFSITSIKDFFKETIFTMNLIENLNLSSNQSEVQKYLLEGEKIEKILKPIINNFESFRYYHTKYQSEFEGDIKFTLSYFKNVILLPTIYSIYKMTYFATEYSAFLKYNIYRIVYLYLQCYKYILICIMTSYDVQNKSNSQIWKKEFETDNIQNLVTTVSESVDYLESRNTQLLNINLILKHLSDNIKYFKIYKKIFKPEKKDEDIENIKIKDINKRDLLVIVPPIIEDYLEKKKEYEENNIFHSIFTDEQKENIQKIIAIDLLNRFIYPRDKQSANFDPNLHRKALKFGTIREPTNRRQSSNTLLISGTQRRSIKDMTLKLKLQREKLEHIGTFYNPYISTFIESKESIIESIDLCFKSNPDHWQDIIVDESIKEKELVHILINKQLPFLIQFIFIEFNRIDTVESPYYKNFINVLEFLRLFCEDHNPLFQTMFINYDKAVGNIDLEDFGKDVFIPFIFRIPILVLKNMKHSLEKVELLENFKHFNFEYFSPLLEKVTDFLIEIIQGTYPENFEDLSASNDEISHSGLELYFKKHYQFLDFVDSSSEYEEIISFFITFLNCFIEENSNPMRIKIPFILKLNPKKLISVAINAFRKLIIKTTGNQIIKSGCSNDLLELFIDFDEKLVGDPLFNISTGIFLYIQRINSFKDKALGDQIHQILNSLQELLNDPQAEEENSMKLLKKEYYTFCSTIIKKNEISFTEDKSKDEKEVYRYKNFFSKNFKKVIIFRNSNCSKKTNFENVFFMVHPDSLFLEPRDTISFLSKADFSNFNAKLNSILDYYSEIENLIMMRKSLNNNKLLLFLFQINYKDLELVNAACATVTNICLVFGKDNNFFDNVMIPFAFLHLIFLSALILNWYTFSYMKHLQLSQEKETFWDFFSFIISSMFNMEIFPFVATLIVGIPAILINKLRFLFSLQLFPIFNIFDTIRSVLYSIQVRYKQFLSTAFLLVILILFYASVTLFYFRTMDDGTELCSSYLECFLYLFNYGIRAGGVPFNIKIDRQDGFWSEFLFSWVFYFIIILIVLNIINGIIVDTFQALREQNNQIDEEKTNVCFICSLHRSNFEIKGIDFDYHQQHEHNIDNYFKYILKIKKTDEHDLNSIDFQVFNSIKQHKIEFFPIKKAKSLEN